MGSRVELIFLLITDVLQAARAMVFLHQWAFPLELLTQLQKPASARAERCGDPCTLCGLTSAPPCAVLRTTQINPRAAAAEQALLRLVPTRVNISKTYFGDGKLVNLEMTGN